MQSVRCARSSQVRLHPQYLRDVAEPGASDNKLKLPGGSRAAFFMPIMCLTRAPRGAGADIGREVPGIQVSLLEEAHHR